MSSVDRIIYDALLRKQDVALPGVGQLRVRRMSARRVSANKIAPPRNFVAFTTDEVHGAVPVAELLADSWNISEEEASGHYREWLGKARSDRGVVIDGVGEIRDGKFISDADLRAALNPVGEHEVVLEERERDYRGGPLWLWILGGIALAAVVLLFINYCGGGLSGLRKGSRAKTENVVVTPVQEPVTDTVTVVSEPAEVKPQLPRYHIIAGSFAVEANADKLIASLKRQHPDMDLTKLRSRWNDNWLVSIFNAPTEREAYNAVYKNLDIEPYIWVYTEK